MSVGFLPLPGLAGQSLQPSHAGVDARQSRRERAKSGSVVPHQQYELERGLRPHGSAGRKISGSRRLGHAGEQQRRRVRQRQVAARRRRNSSSDAAGARWKRWAGPRKADERSGAAQFAQENFSEYHLYSLERRTSIQNNESKQISLLNGTGVPVEKYLMVEGQPYYYRNPQGIGNADPAAGESLLPLQERTKEPAGHAAARRNGARLSSGFEGRRAICGRRQHQRTPRKTKQLKIYVGNAFDVVCERKQTDYKKLAYNLYEMEYADHAAKSQGRPGERWKFASR